MPWFYYAGRFLSWFLLKCFARLRVKGLENVPKEGPFLVVANHIATADPPVLAVCIRRKMIFMAKDELFQVKWKAYFIRNFGAFPVYREKLDTKVLRRADEATGGQRITNYKLQITNYELRNATRRAVFFVIRNS